jgi:hypothetical protein
LCAAAAGISQAPCIIFNTFVRSDFTMADQAGSVAGSVGVEGREDPEAKRQRHDNAAAGSGFSSMQQAQESMQQAQESMRRAENARTDALGSMRRAEESIRRAEASGIPAEKEAAQKRIDDAQQRIDDAQKRIDDAQKRIDDAQAEVRAAQKRIDDAQTVTGTGTAQVPLFNEDGNRFWQRLVLLGALLLTAGTNCIDLPVDDRVRLFDKMCKQDCPTLFIREVYKALFPVTMDFMRRETGATMIFVGNPGIGKTRFMMYTIIRAVKEDWLSIVVDAPVMFGNRLFVIEPHGVNEYHRDGFEVQDDSLYLFDAAGDSVRDRTLSAKHKIIYSSPDIKGYKSSTKTPNTLFNIVPPFLCEEIRNLQ